MSAWRIERGDVRTVLRALPKQHFDAVLCDPPYGIRMMNRKWDYDVPSKRVWRLILQRLRPGAPVLAFGGTRTFHRATCAMEDGGLEIRNVISWIYGQGFAKSLNVSKAIDERLGAERPIIGHQTLTGSAALSTKEKGGTYAAGTESAGRSKTIPITGPATSEAARWDGYGTDLKPGWEPCVLARAPVDGTVAANVLAHGVGGLSVDACRLERLDGDRFEYGRDSVLPHANTTSAMGRFVEVRPYDATKGRWPPNVALGHSSECGDDGCHRDCPVRMLDEQSGDRPGMSGGGAHAAGYGGGMLGGIDSTHTARGDRGGASRFFYTAKSPRSEREFGCDELDDHGPDVAVGRVDGSAGASSPRAGAGRRGRRKNIHPTVKPISLLVWLARLILPPPREDGEPRRILVPYSGSGSEMIGAFRAGWDEAVGIEREPEYIQIAEARIKRWLQVQEHVEPKDVRPVREDERQVSLFGGAR